MRRMGGFVKLVRNPDGRKAQLREKHSSLFQIEQSCQAPEQRPQSAMHSLARGKVLRFVEQSRVFVQCALAKIATVAFIRLFEVDLGTESLPVSPDGNYDGNLK